MREILGYMRGLAVTAFVARFGVWRIFGCAALAIAVTCGCLFAALTLLLN